MTDSAVLTLIYDEITEAVAPVAVYQSVPDGTLYPYVEINSLQALSAEILDSDKYHVIIRVNIWSEYLGQKEVIDLMEKIYSRLHRKDYAFTGGRTNDIVVKDRMAHRDVDNITYMGSMSIHVWSELNPV